jgi:sugar phosphate isomerase/epimerase
MKIIFGKSNWEVGDASIEDFLIMVKKSGFDTTEIYLLSLSEDTKVITEMHQKYELDLIAQIITQGIDLKDHIRSLEEQFRLALQCRAILINAHAGRDIFSFEDNLRIFKRGLELGRDAGINVCYETHRGRPTYSVTQTVKYLESLPDMRLTADFSHWMVVHESRLEDQREDLQLAMARSDHIHARVGYEEGPQIPDPRAPEWKPNVENHVELWQQIAENHRKRGSDYLTITPEFGPPLYMHTLPFTAMPVADVWDINVYMKKLLKKRIRA